MTSIQQVQNIGDQITLEVDSLHNSDILLLKFTPQGTLLWSKIYGGPGWILSYNFLLRENDLLIVGHFRDTLWFDSEMIISVNDMQDMFIASVDLDGTGQWARRYGSTGHDRLYEISEHENGDLAVCGYSNGEWQFGSTMLLKSESQFDGFTGRLTADGEPMWATQLLRLDKTNATVWSVTTDNENNTYICTTMDGETMIHSMMFDAQESSQVAIVKYTNTGDLAWLHVSNTNGSLDKTQGRTIRYSDGRLWVGGNIGRGAEIFGNEYNDLDTINFNVSVLDKNGNLLAEFQDGGTGYALCLDFFQ